MKILRKYGKALTLALLLQCASCGMNMKEFKGGAWLKDEILRGMDVSVCTPAAIKEMQVVLDKHQQAFFEAEEVETKKLEPKMRLLAIKLSEYEEMGQIGKVNADNWNQYSYHERQDIRFGQALYEKTQRLIEYVKQENLAAINVYFAAIRIAANDELDATMDTLHDSQECLLKTKTDIEGKYTFTVSNDEIKSHNQLFAYSRDENVYWAVELQKQKQIDLGSQNINLILKRVNPSPQSEPSASTDSNKSLE